MNCKCKFPCMCSVIAVVIGIITGIIIYKIGL